MQLPLAYYGDPILRKKAARIETFDDNLKKLVADMTETLRAHNGLGLAAPQVKHSVALFLISIPFKAEDGKYHQSPIRVFINPKILSVSQECWIHSEGCLSIPKLYADVERPFKIKIEASDINGKLFVEEFSEWEARAILHENDHLNGVLFIDRVHGKERNKLDPFLRDIKKKFYKS